MALQGSLNDFALPDVLHLLSSTSKSGELHVRGDRGDGHIWLAGGRVICTEAGTSTEAVDTVFELLRLEEGHFLFTVDIEPERRDEPRDIEPLLAEAEARLKEWRVIEAVVPSLATEVGLVSELRESVEIDPDSWRVLVAAASGGSVDAVAHTMSCSEFEACRAVKALVDRKLVEVLSTERRDAPLGLGAMDIDSLVELPARRRRPTSENGNGSPTPARRTRPVAAPIEEPEPQPPLEDAADLMSSVTVEERAALDEAGLVDENGEPINRSLLLKFLSSVRS